MIKFKDGVFLLGNENFTYSFYVRDKKLIHSYFGRTLSAAEKIASSGKDAKDYGRDWNLCEVGESGRGDFRIPSVAVKRGGVYSTEFEYISHEILKAKPAFGMPALRDGGETLKIKLYDEVLKCGLYLYYTVYEEGLVRRVEIENGGGRLSLYVLDSACTEFPAGSYEYISLDGRWGKERAPYRGDVAPGIHAISSARGISSHQHNPFIAIAKKGAGEECGEVFGFNLIYSGNFNIRCELDEKSQLRVNAGINFTEGGIELGEGEIFSTPELVAVYSDGGLGKMSRLFHKLYRRHLINPAFADKIRPVVLNSWESCYFDFDEEKLKNFIRGSAGLGFDTFVLDDGWFGRRDNDDCSLGDWYVDKRKLPSGLDGIIDCCRQNGLKFGIWFEPEAVNPDSDLYRAHPEWALHTAGRRGIEMRNQYMLDFSNPQVVDYIFTEMSALLEKHDISYIKWDMNRPLSDVDSPEKYIGYVKGVYSLYERLASKFPQVLIEGCCSGGGRFDGGILYYSPMIWTSDDTDAYERAQIQYGTSYCYPLQTMSNHVSVCPNHQTGRVIPFSTRGAVASLGCFGYELDVTKLDGEERECVKAQIAAYRENARLILTGDVYRLINPFADGAFCMEVAAEDGNGAYLVYACGTDSPNLPLKAIELKGLEENSVYKIEQTGELFTGAELMHGGIVPETERCDFASATYKITRVKKQ